MEIKSGQGYPASALSNFAPHKFEFDGVQINSMEGLLQSLKFDKIHIQREVCKLVGMEAKTRGKSRNLAWRRVQKLWWQGVSMDRKGEEYQIFLDQVYLALTEQSESFRKALLATNDAVLTHSLGSRKESETVLTRSEFCSRLMALRDLLKNGDIEIKT